MFTNIRQNFVNMLVFSDAGITHSTYSKDAQCGTVTIFTKKFYINALFNMHECPLKLFRFIYFFHFMLIETLTCRSNAVTVVLPTIY